MKNYNLSSTFTVLPNKNQQKINKEKYNVLNRNNNNINNTKQTFNNKHRQYNSAIHINNLNQSKNKDNNIDNNVSYQNQPNKELISSMSLNNFEDLDEKLDIKLPYNNDNKNIVHSMINTFGNQNSNNSKNIRSKIISNKDKEKLNTKLISSKNEVNSKENNWYDENYNGKLFNTFKLGNFFQFFQKKSEISDLKNKYIQNNKIENRNNTIDRKMIYNSKKYKNLEENNLEKENFLNENNNMNRNYNYLNKNKNLFKNYYKNYNVTFENEHINRHNNIYLSKGPSGAYMRNIINENKDTLNFSNNNKKKFSVTKKDLHQFKKNEYYIQKIMENLPLNKNKNIRNNFNIDHRIHYKNENIYHSKLNNKDNNVDYYIYNNKNLYNNYLNKELSNNSLNNNSILNNINNNNIKTVRVSKHLSVGKPNLIKNNNNEHKYFNLRNNNKNKRISEKQSIKESNLILIKNRNNSILIFDIKILKIFLDINTLINLFSINRDIFRKTREFFYTYFYNKLMKDKNKDKYIHQVLNSAKNFCSAKIKEKIKNKELKSFFNKLLKKNEIYDELILKDITRTMPNDSSFNKGKINYQKLYNILTCFSNYNKKIGYAQGLNFICGQAIYLFSSEEDVFIFLEGFINLMKMDNFFDARNEIVYKLNYFSKILNKYVPKIIKFLEDKSVGHDFFSTRWILTLFSTSMERNYLVVVWCFMIIFRWKFVCSFIVQILTRYERNIINSTEGQLCYKMKNILRVREFKSDFSDIIKETLNFMKNHIIL